VCLGRLACLSQFFLFAHFLKNKSKWHVAYSRLIVGDDLLLTNLELHLRGDQKINEFFFFFAWKLIFQHIHLKTPRNKKKTILSIKKSLKHKIKQVKNFFLPWFIVSGHMKALKHLNVTPIIKRNTLTPSLPIFNQNQTN